MNKWQATYICGKSYWRDMWVIIPVRKYDEVACKLLATCALTWSNSVGVTLLQNGLKLGDKYAILKVKRSK
jgi:hypothetical protein